MLPIGNVKWDKSGGITWDRTSTARDQGLDMIRGQSPVLINLFNDLNVPLLQAKANPGDPLKPGIALFMVVGGSEGIMRKKRLSYLAENERSRVS
jgi:hypothetical protein